MEYSLEGTTQAALQICIPRKRRAGIWPGRTTTQVLWQMACEFVLEYVIDDHFWCWYNSRFWKSFYINGMTKETIRSLSSRNLSNWLQCSRFILKIRVSYATKIIFAIFIFACLGYGFLQLDGSVPMAARKFWSCYFSIDLQLHMFS